MAAQISHQKSYDDKMTRPLEFMIGDNVWLKVSSKKDVVRFWKKGKLSSRFIDPFEILRKVGAVAYELALPPRLFVVHPIFHVSMLCRYIPDASHMISYDLVELGLDLAYEEEPIAISDRKDCMLRTKDIPSVKVVLLRRLHGSWSQICWPDIPTFLRLQVFPFLLYSRMNILFSGE